MTVFKKICYILIKTKRTVTALKILLADPDRDFLASFKKLLELSGHETICVFDGTQVIYRMIETRPDIVILDSDIPRISYKVLLSQLNEKNIPVVCILHSKINPDILISDNLAASYITLPFFPTELSEHIEQTIRTKNSGEKLAYEDVEIDEASFMLCGKLRVTAEEINVFKALIKKEEMISKQSGAYITSLNNKFSKLNKKIRIRYVMQEGFRLVTDNE